MELKKKLSYNIERVETEITIPIRCHHTYNFKSNQFLENVDEMEWTGIEHNEIKENLIESLVNEFRISLNNVVFGDPAGRHYVDHLEKEKNKNKK